MTENHRLGLKMRDEIASRSGWLWAWQQALFYLYEQSDLKVLVDRWSGTGARPAFAYVYVEDATYQGNPSR